ncbi:hypothetical protein SELMODRAFT_406957 [Selaginella moellendorffii]|uniref:F-box domain-containing protein n=1 Tax=Selaginella moellendorffii TaxID=88036 RepID=D8R3G7_SELML|nr:hypothetical protein SELMODRAFT_406957 [Selaginella moellendorffii]
MAEPKKMNKGLSDDLIANILEGIEPHFILKKKEKKYAGYSLVCKRWSRVGRDIGALSVKSNWWKTAAGFQEHRDQVVRRLFVTVNPFEPKPSQDRRCFSWLRKVGSTLEELRIKYDGMSPQVDLNDVSTCSMLRHLTLGCNVVGSIQVGFFPWLRSCVLGRVDAYVCQQLLDSSPVLEEFEISRVVVRRRRTQLIQNPLRSVSLKSFRLRGIRGPDELKLDFPNLEAAEVLLCSAKVVLQTPVLKQLKLTTDTRAMLRFELETSEPLQELEAPLDSFRSIAATLDAMHLTTLTLRCRESDKLFDWKVVFPTVKKVVLICPIKWPGRAKLHSLRRNFPALGEVSCLR